MQRRTDKYRLPDDQIDHTSDVDWNGYTEQFRAFAIALAVLCPNFSDNDVARALDDGLTPDQAADDLNRDHADQVAAEKNDFERQMIHDQSMNA